MAGCLDVSVFGQLPCYPELSRKPLGSGHSSVLGMGVVSVMEQLLIASRHGEDKRVPGKVLDGEELPSHSNNRRRVFLKRCFKKGW